MFYLSSLWTAGTWIAKHCAELSVAQMLTSVATAECGRCFGVCVSARMKRKYAIFLFGAKVPVVALGRTASFKAGWEPQNSSQYSGYCQVGRRFIDINLFFKQNKKEGMRDYII